MKKPDHMVLDDAPPGYRVEETSHWFHEHYCIYDVLEDDSYRGRMVGGMTLLIHSYNGKATEGRFVVELFEEEVYSEHVAVDCEGRFLYDSARRSCLVKGLQVLDAKLRDPKAVWYYTRIEDVVDGQISTRVRGFLRRNKLNTLGQFDTFMQTNAPSAPYRGGKLTWAETKHIYARILAARDGTPEPLPFRGYWVGTNDMRLFTRRDGVTILQRRQRLRVPSGQPTDERWLDLDMPVAIEEEK